ncbi:hypothetical protein IAQ61_005578 [Plenodomus lingam]|nr:hypothetical protein IAQ61_005578 [Plenodomus lingam]
MDYSQYNQSGQLQPHVNSQQQQRQQHNRFSWQAPLQEEASTHDEHEQQVSQQSIQRPQPTTDSTQASSRHFSYAQTPAEHRAFVYTSTPNQPPLPQHRISVAASLFTPIDPRTQSIVDPNSSAPPVPQMAYVPPSYLQDEKPPVSLSARHDPNIQQYHHQQASPQMVMSQPTPNVQINTQQSRHTRQMSNLSPINTNLTTRPLPRSAQQPTSPSTTQPHSPLPHKHPMTPISADSPRRTNHPTTPYSPHGFQTPTPHAIFSPNAPHGPNGLDPALHQPGQITHPNMTTASPQPWSSHLCACSPNPSTCLTGLFCPCLLHSRTTHRLARKAAAQDPTDLLDHRAINPHCLLMTLACGLWCVFPTLQRTRIRHAYKLRGSLAGDVARGCCCCCCVAVQNEREVRGREEARGRLAGPASAEVYVRDPGMVYRAQQ